MWETIFPVIADTRVGAPRCPHKHNGFVPLNYAEGEYKIVGFVQGYIYDVDIGNPPPPEPTCPAGAGANPWSFTLPDGTKPNCNIVRARVKCDTFFIPASNNPSSLSTPSGIIR